ncbi:hypothetical protein [Bacillus cereus]|uniref:Thioredoxin domain-containing protein n=1 Tax=Bacillus cereus HuA3-9 TaxID=1053205 RepID=R8CIA9_BACCE|nr:hypothetical protein [Bacillus cereus]EOO11349.1 hypothetical protein IGA_05612 [Bacillus cereus HuA3-9]
MKVMKFYQTPCTPCNMLVDTMSRLGVTADEEYNVKEEKGMEMAGEFGVVKTPVLILLDDTGAEVQRYQGVGQSKVTEIFTKRGLL